MYVTLSELAIICGFTQSTAQRYCYQNKLPNPAISKSGQCGGKPASKWLIDDVMIYKQTLIKSVGYKDVDLKKVIELTNQGITRAEMSKIFKIPEYTIGDACTRNGIKSQVRRLRNNKLPKIKERSLFDAFLFAQVR